MAPTSIIIDRATRDVLFEELKYEGCRVEDFPRAVSDIERDRDEAVRALATARFVVDVLDQIGWDLEDDRDEYELRTEREPLVEYLCRASADMESDIGHDTVSLRRQREGDEMEVNIGMTSERSIDVTQRNIDENARRLDLFRRLLEDLRCDRAAVKAVA